MVGELMATLSGLPGAHEVPHGRLPEVVRNALSVPAKRERAALIVPSSCSAHAVNKEDTARESPYVAKRRQRQTQVKVAPRKSRAVTRKG
jgi:hypothetical protein